jgi:hypothetical protein
MTDPLGAIEQMRLYLPQHLSYERQEQLRKDLRAFPNTQTIYTTYPIDADILQGDGWRGFLAIDFHSREGKLVSGMVLSNSCDVDPRNPRTMAPNITFAPLLKLSTYIARLSAAGVEAEQVDDTVAAIRRQEVTFLMYLPPIAGELDESVARFDDLHGHAVLQTSLAEKIEAGSSG